MREAFLDGHSQVAIKKSLFVGSLARSSISKELAFLKAIKPHTNVARILGVCIDMPDGDVGIVMEFCAGGSLKSYLKKLPQVRLCTVITRLNRTSEYQFAVEKVGLRCSLSQKCQAQAAVPVLPSIASERHHYDCQFCHTVAYGFQLAVSFKFCWSEPACRVMPFAGITVSEVCC